MAGDGNMEAHVATYAGVMALFKWSALSAIVITLLVILAIS